MIQPATPAPPMPPNAQSAPAPILPGAQSAPAPAEPKQAGKYIQEAQTLETVYKINPLFKQKYVQNIKGKEFVKYDGLLYLAKIKGIKSLTVKVIQFPNPDNNHTAICEATLVGWDKSPDKNVIEVTHTEIGDANVTNVNHAVAAHFVRISATRAKGRAFRDYLGIDAVMEEELLDFGSNNDNAKMVTQVEKSQIGAQPVIGQPDVPITPQQISDVNQLLGQLGWTGEQFQGFVSQLFPTLADMSTMSNLQANHLISQLKAHAGVF